MKIHNQEFQRVYTRNWMRVLSILFIFSLVSCSPGTPMDATGLDASNSSAKVQTQTALEEPETEKIPSVLDSEAEAEIESTDSRDDEGYSSESNESTEEIDEFLESLGQQDMIAYETQSGDTLNSVALHFDVLPGEIKSPEAIPDTGFMNPGQMLYIPDRLENTSSNEKLLPDSEVIYSMTSADFNINNFVIEADGYINKYRELLGSGWQSGSELVFTVASDFSINPRLLLAILEYQSHWVYQKPTTQESAIFPMGYIEEDHEELYSQMGWVAQQLCIGYYGWRDGSLTTLDFPDGGHIRLSPELNAGTVALQYLFSQLYDQKRWEEILYEPDGLLMLYDLMFSNPWERDALMVQKYGPIIPGNLQQPEMVLPFKVGHPWNLTGGPHPVWGTQGPWAALDFAPQGIQKCAASKEYVTAVAPGLIVRLGEGPVVEDMDGDGFEQSGWSILYMHIAFHDRVAEGTYVDTNDYIGHPSCYGGRSTGTHVHIGRKYNGEWIKAEGPVSFDLSGWQARDGVSAYSGKLVNGDLTVEASDFSGLESLIIRE